MMSMERLGNKVSSVYGLVIAVAICLLLITPALAAVPHRVSQEIPYGPYVDQIVFSEVSEETDALAVENILASLTLAPSPFSLEIAGTENGRGFLIRGEEGMVKHIASEIQAAYGQAECVPLDGKDPARIAPGEIVAQGLHDDGIVLIAVTSQQPGSQVKRTGLV